MSHNQEIKDTLLNIIAEMTAEKEKYVKNPGKDFIRNRKLSLQTVIEFILSMEGGALNKALYEFFDKEPKNIVTASALVQQRNKIKPELFYDLFHKSNEVMGQYDIKTYKGYNLYAIDGSDINVARDENADTYCNKINQYDTGCNMYHLNAIYDILNKVYVDAELQPKPQADERRAFISMLKSLHIEKSTLFIADRGYPSYNLLTHFKYKDNADYLVRMQNNGSNLVKNLPMTECDIEKTITITTNRRFSDKDGYKFVQTRKGNQQNRVYKDKPSRAEVQWDFGEFEELKIRIVRFKITDTTYETIFTSLSKDEFSLEEIKKLYAMRWGIETSFRELKYIIGLTNLHSKKDEFVRQEIFAKLTMYNFCERIIAAAVVTQDDGRKYKYQVNYTQAMHVCLDFFRCHDDYYFDVYGLITKYILPIRPGRKDKRKLQTKGFVFFLYRVAA